MSTISITDAKALIPMRQDRRPPVWIIGSGMTVPGHGLNGVPGTVEMTRRIIDSMQVDPDHSAAARVASLKEKVAENIAHNWSDLYQEACAAMQHVNNNELNHTVRRAVLESSDDPRALANADVEDTSLMSDAVGSPDVERKPKFRVISRNSKTFVQWSIRPGLAALANIVRHHPSTKGGHIVVTTNFDPLISVALNLAGAHHARYTMDGDFQMGMVTTEIPLVAHVHGYWLGPAKMLNLKDKIEQNVRLNLRSSLSSAFNERTIVVAGYRGWDDVVMGALKECLKHRGTIIWLVHDEGVEFESSREAVSARLGADEDDALYFVSGVDADKFFCELSDKVNTIPKKIDSENIALRQELETCLKDLSEKVDHKKAIHDIQSRILLLVEAFARVEDHGAKAAQQASIDILNSSIERLSTNVSSQSERTTKALTEIRTSAKIFGDTTTRFKSDFDEHRGHQKGLLAQIQSDVSKAAHAGISNGLSKYFIISQFIITCVVLVLIIATMLKSFGMWE